MDLVAFVPGLPERGGAVWSPPPARFAGGTAANVAAGLVALGVPAAFAGCVGDDEYGRFLASDLESGQVDISCLRHDRHAGTGVAIAIVEPGGERTFLACALGAAQTRLSVEDIDRIDALAPAAIFLTGLVLLEEPARSSALELVQRHSGKTAIYFDPNLRQPESESMSEISLAMRRVAGLSSVVLAGEGEASSLGIEPGAGRTLILKRGAAGARLISADGAVVDLAAYPVEAVDTNGAGDAFNAGYIAARARGYGEHDAAAVANATAALSVTRPGARSVPGWDAVIRLSGLVG